MAERETRIMLMAFVAITVITALVALAANIGLFGEDVRLSNFSSWALTAVLAEIIGATVLAFRRLVVAPGTVYVNVDFPDKDPIDVDLDGDSCTYQITRDHDKIENRAIIVFGEGGWQCQLPPSVRATDIVQLSLIERTGQKWEVRPFRPMITTQTALSVD